MQYKITPGSDGNSVVIIPEKQDNDTLANTALIFCGFTTKTFLSGPGVGDDLLAGEKISPDGHYFRVYLDNAGENGQRAIYAEIIKGRADDKSRRQLSEAVSKLENLSKERN